MRLAGLLVALCAGWLCPGAWAAPPAAGQSDETIAVAGVQRQYVLYIPPSYDGKKRLPLVLVLHGFGGNAPGMVGSTGFNDKARTEGFFVAYLQGSRVGPASPSYVCGCPQDPAAWNDGITPNTDVHANDVLFARVVIEALSGQLAVDRNRVYATGLSNGATMTHRLGADLPNLLAGIAPVAGSVGVRAWEGDRPAGPYRHLRAPRAPVAAIIFHGVSDDNVLYNGGKSGSGGLQLDAVPVAKAVDLWKSADGCRNALPQQTDAAGNTITGFGGCEDATDVVLHSLITGEHHWPTSQNESKFSATDVMWDFFADHPHVRGGVLDARCAASSCTVTLVQKSRAIARLTRRGRLVATGRTRGRSNKLRLKARNRLAPGSYLLIVRIGRRRPVVRTVEVTR